MKGELTMRALIILVITFAILATQFYWGVRKQKRLGAIIPLVLTALIIAISFLAKTAEFTRLKATPVILSDRTVIPWDITKSSATGFRSIKKDTAPQRAVSHTYFIEMYILLFFSEKISFKDI